MIRFNFENVNSLSISDTLNNNQGAIILIEKFPNDNQPLADFLQQIGLPINEDRNLDFGSIFEVKIDKHGGHFKSYASSNLSFPLHTDCSDFEAIPNCVALYCVQADEQGGESIFAQLSKIIKVLPSDILEILKTKNWSFRNVNRKIISSENGVYSICYNRIMLESYSELTNEDTEILNIFDSICQKVSFQFKLKPGDLILFRNDKILHGRTEFPIHSKRLIKRARLSLNPNKKVAPKVTPKF